LSERYHIVIIPEIVLYRALSVFFELTAREFSIVVERFFPALDGVRFVSGLLLLRYANAKDVLSRVLSLRPHPVTTKNTAITALTIPKILHTDIDLEAFFISLWLSSHKE
jgi:hypothetical protein